MTTVISCQRIEDIIAKGGDPKSLPADAILTPSAKDALARSTRIARRSSAGGSRGCRRARKAAQFEKLESRTGSLLQLSLLPRT